jgi:hypothetical protein
MNKKILGIIAGIATVGSAVFAAPAYAVEQMVDVTVKVDSVVYLRTFKNIDLKVSQGDLGGTDGDQMTTSTDGSALIDKTAPGTLTSGTQRTVTKKISELYAAWGNSGNVEIKVEPVEGNLLTGPIPTTGSAKKAKLSVVSVSTPTGPLDAETPVFGGIELKVDFLNATGTAAAAPDAGTYTGGQLKVVATPQL